MLERIFCVSSKDLFPHVCTCANAKVRERTHSLFLCVRTQGSPRLARVRKVLQKILVNVALEDVTHRTP